jgi:hypothetical protein
MYNILQGFWPSNPNRGLFWMFWCIQNSQAERTSRTRVLGTVTAEWFDLPAGGLRLLTACQFYSHPSLSWMLPRGDSMCMMSPYRYPGEFRHFDHRALLGDKPSSLFLDAGPFILPKEEFL